MEKKKTAKQMIRGHKPEFNMLRKMDLEGFRKGVVDLLQASVDNLMIEIETRAKERDIVVGKLAKNFKIINSHFEKIDTNFKAANADINDLQQIVANLGYFAFVQFIDRANKNGKPLMDQERKEMAKHFGVNLSQIKKVILPIQRVEATS